MRVPPFSRFGTFLKLLGIFITGSFVGAAILHMFHIAQFEALYHLRMQQQNKLIQYESDIKSLTQYKNRNSVIKSLKLTIENEYNEAARPDLDSLTEQELLKLVRKDLSLFIGQSIYDIDSDSQFARKLLEKRIYQNSSGEDYIIDIKTVLLVDNVLQIWMTVREHAPKPK